MLNLRNIDTADIAKNLKKDELCQKRVQIDTTTREMWKDLSCRYGMTETAFITQLIRATYSQVFGN